MAGQFGSGKQGRGSAKKRRGSNFPSFADIGSSNPNILNSDPEFHSGGSSVDMEQSEPFAQEPYSLPSQFRAPTKLSRETQDLPYVDNSTILKQKVDKVTKILTEAVLESVEVDHFIQARQVFELAVSEAFSELFSDSLPGASVGPIFESKIALSVFNYYKDINKYGINDEHQKAYLSGILTAMLPSEVASPTYMGKKMAYLKLRTDSRRLSLARQARKKFKKF